VTPAERDRYAALPALEAVRAMLDADPKLSGLQLQALLAECGQVVSATQCRAWRKAIRAGLAPTDADEPAEAESPAAGIKRLLDTAIATNDRGAVATYTRALATAEGLASAHDAPDAAEDWCALNEVEASALAFLCARARNEVLDAEAQWWNALFVRIAAEAERNHVPHPAHVPLPAGTPLADALDVPRG